jgi:cell division protein DivIC
MSFKIRKALKHLKNKYIITLTAFIIWLLFFDKNDIVSQVQLSQKLNDLIREKQYYTDEIAKNKQDMIELKTNPKNLEKFAREKYLMKRDNEEIYVIVEE